MILLYTHKIPGVQGLSVTSWQETMIYKWLLYSKDYLFASFRWDEPSPQGKLSFLFEEEVDLEAIISPQCLSFFPLGLGMGHKVLPGRAFEVAFIEAFFAFIAHLVKNSCCNDWPVIIYYPSAMLSQADEKLYKINGLNRDGRLDNYSLLVRDLGQLANNSGIEIRIVENKEVLGQKNSAQIKRLFYK